MSKISWTNIALLLFAFVGLVIGSRIDLSLPGTPVPQTLQTMVVIIIAAVLPQRLGVIAVLLYLLSADDIKAARAEQPKNAIKQTKRPHEPQENVMPLRPSGVPLAFPKSAWREAALTMSEQEAGDYLDEWVFRPRDALDELARKGELQIESEVSQILQSWL